MERQWLGSGGVGIGGGLKIASNLDIALLTAVPQISHFVSRDSRDGRGGTGFHGVPLGVTDCLAESSNSTLGVTAHQQSPWLRGDHCFGRLNRLAGRPWPMHRPHCNPGTPSLIGLPKWRPTPGFTWRSTRNSHSDMVLSCRARRP